MKKSLITIIVFLIAICNSGYIYSQSDSQFNTYKTQVNIELTNIFAKNYIYYDYYFIDGDIYPTLVYDNLFHSPGVQFGLKFQNAKGAFRLSTAINYSSTIQEEDDNYGDKSSYKSFGSGLNFGYEFHKTVNRVVIYYGLDINTDYSSRKFSYENPSINGTNESETLVNEYALGVSPLLGVNVYLFKNLSVGTEVCYFLQYYSGNEKSTYSGGEDAKSKFHGFRSWFGPLGFLSVNIHL